MADSKRPAELLRLIRTLNTCLLHVNPFPRANNKGADQPVQMHRLVNTFVVCNNKIELSYDKAYLIFKSLHSGPTFTI